MDVLSFAGTIWQHGAQPRRLAYFQQAEERMLANGSNVMLPLHAVAVHEFDDSLMLTGKVVMNCILRNRTRFSAAVLITAFILLFGIGISPSLLSVSAQDTAPTIEPTIDHTAHHPTPEATETAIPEGSESDMGQMDMGDMDMSAMMQPMLDLMDEMMGMDMPDDMHSMMEQMRGMMDMMMSMMSGGDMMSGMGDMDMSAMMQPMLDLMDEMMGMDMSSDLHGMMEQMRGMVDMMMSMMGVDIGR